MKNYISLFRFFTLIALIMLIVSFLMPWWIGYFATGKRSGYTDGAYGIT
jgi:hypothetical protein